MTAVVDARPSDAVALALRANCPIRVAQSALDMVRTDSSGPDALPEPGETPGEADKPDEDEGSDEGGSKGDPGA